MAPTFNFHIEIRSVMRAVKATVYVANHSLTRKKIFLVATAYGFLTTQGTYAESSEDIGLFDTEGEAVIVADRQDFVVGRRVKTYNGEATISSTVDYETDCTHWLVAAENGYLNWIGWVTRNISKARLFRDNTEAVRFAIQCGYFAAQ
jgi:hypothetical protein